MKKKRNRQRRIKVEKSKVAFTQVSFSLFSSPSACQTLHSLWYVGLSKLYLPPKRNEITIMLDLKVFRHLAASMNLSRSSLNQPHIHTIRLTVSIWCAKSNWTENDGHNHRHLFGTLWTAPASSCCQHRPSVQPLYQLGKKKGFLTLIDRHV